MELIVRWVSYGGDSFDPTERIGRYGLDWDFQNLEHLADLAFPEINDKNVVNPIEDVRAGFPDKNGEVDVCFNYLCCRENGETFPVPARAVLEPLYGRLEDAVAYKNQIGKNVLPLRRDEKGRELMFRLDTDPPIFRYIREYHESKGQKMEIWDEEVGHRPDWAQRIGLTGLPFILPDGSKLFVVHGSQNSDGIYRYSLGTAVWESGEWEISEEPLLTPRMVREELEKTKDWEYGELRPDFKEVIYSDAIITPNGKKNTDEIYMPINLGDTAVVMVELYMEDLLGSLNI